MAGCGDEPAPVARNTNDGQVAESMPDTGSPGSSERAQPSDSAVTQKNTLPKIVAFGDSLTAGFGVAPQDTYPAQLQRRLDAAGYRYLIVNAGVSGDTTAGGVRRVSWILNADPYMVILELGGNDGLRGLNLDQTRANLETIITRLKQAGVVTVLAGMKLPVNYGADYRARFESMYRDLAVHHGLLLIPFFLEGVGGDHRLNQPDGIHPTGEGYRIVADSVFRALEPLLNHKVSNGTGAQTDRSAPTRPGNRTDRR
ncbi:MAG TPA: arylesterase [Nitrospiraceae bacterium]|nr:arylesterase [Nitrospiraceae bacterium]